MSTPILTIIHFLNKDSKLPTEFFLPIYYARLYLLTCLLREGVSNKIYIFLGQSSG